MDMKRGLFFIVRPILVIAILMGGLHGSARPALAAVQSNISIPAYDEQVISFQI